MKPVLVLQHGPEVAPGRLHDTLVRLRIPHRVVRLDHAEPVPADSDRWAGIVSLGGAMGAYDTEEHPYLVEEKKLLTKAHTAATPVLGICLGSQLAAAALGGDAYRAPRTEAITVRFGGNGGDSDPVVDQLDALQLSFHQDTFTPPPAASVLYRSDRYPLAFRLRSTIAVQTHPEIEPEVAEGWFATAVGRAMLAEAGADGATLLAELRDNVAASRDSAHRFFTAWLDEVYG